jgi:phage baseplate assembly protein W|tara:strand:+ start:266 stop:718 length:453 start_codon:yes stop_codon:yes gene_type:complete
MAVKNFNEVNSTTQGISNTRIFRGHSSVGRDFADSKLYDIELVKQDLLNHFNILKGEKLENPDFGTNIWLYLMDPLDDETRNAVIEEVEAIINYDPRVEMDSIEVNDYEQGLQVKVSVIYTGYGIGESMDLLFDTQQGLLAGPTQVYSAS